MCMCMCMRTCAHIDRCMHVCTIFTEHKQDITGLYLFRLILDINLLHKSGVLAMAWSPQFVDNLCWRLKALGAPKVPWLQISLLIGGCFRKC